MGAMSELDIDMQERARHTPRVRVPFYKRLQLSCGTRVAALYLRGRGYTLRQALDLLSLRGGTPNGN